MEAYFRPFVVALPGSSCRGSVVRMCIALDSDLDANPRVKCLLGLNSKLSVCVFARAIDRPHHALTLRACAQLDHIKPLGSWSE